MYKLINRTDTLLPCPKCGKKNEARMRTRFLPRAFNMFADEDIIQVRCIVKEHGCDFWCNVWKPYKLIDIEETPDDEAIKELMDEACATFYGYVKERWTKGEKNESSEF